VNFIEFAAMKKSQPALTFDEEKIKMGNMIKENEESFLKVKVFLNQLDTQALLDAIEVGKKYI